jgi:hypothetical protein
MMIKSDLQYRVILFWFDHVNDIQLIQVSSKYQIYLRIIEYIIL